MTPPPDAVPVDLDAIEARWVLLMGVQGRRHFPSSYVVVKFDVPALVAALRELRELAIVEHDFSCDEQMNGAAWRQRVLLLTGGDPVPDDVEAPPTAWINEGLVGEMGAPG